MSRQRGYSRMTLEPGTTEDVFVGHITDPDNFFIQLSRTADCLEDLRNLLMNQYKNSVAENRNWHLDDACAALYTDGEWYRGLVTGVPHRKDRLEVSFVDYGNKDYIEKENVRSLGADLFEQPIQSFHCRLEGVCSAENFWSPEHVAKFEDLALEKDFTANIISYDSSQDVYSIQLTTEHGENINQKFGEMTNSSVIQASPGAGKRCVRASDGFDLRVTLGGGTPGQRARGIAQSLGVNMNGGSLSQSTIPQVSLKVGDKVDVTVVFVVSPFEFWCQVLKFSQAADQLAKLMAVTYNKMGPGEGILHNLRPGSICAGLCEEDHVWYRAIIQKVTGPKATIFFLDYGNTDTVSVGNVKELKEEFRSLPAQAVKFSLSGIKPHSGEWSEAATIAFEELVMENQYAAAVVEKSQSGRYHVSLVDLASNVDVAASFLATCKEAGKGPTRSPSPPDQASVPSEMPKYLTTSVQTPSKSEVFISWLESPSEFYLQLADNQSVVESLTDGIQEFYESQRSSEATNVRPGSMVVSRFSEDDAWYRCLVKKISDSIAEIEFVDFGNRDEVPITSLRHLDKQFSKIPAQAVRCSLHGVRPLSQGSTWSGDAKHFLEELTQDGATCKFLTCKSGVYEVELESKGKNVAKEMVAHAVVRGVVHEEVASGPRYQPMQVGKGTYSVYVGYIDTVENFCVQLSETMPKLDNLMVEMEDFYNAGKGKLLTNPQVGMPCTAKFEEDDLWYRAQVRSFSSKDIDVFFVDYGNIQSSPRNTVFHMEPTFLNSLPAQAVQCRLSIDKEFNPEAQSEKFTDVTGQEELEMVVRGKEGSKLVVDLLKDGMSVTDKLRGGSAAVRESPGKATSGYTPGKVRPGQTVLAFASFIESPSRFWVQLAGSDDELTSMMETLSKHYGSGKEPPLTGATAGQPCVALYDEDKQWYRALVLSVHGTEMRVQFVDYGNTELVDRQNIKAISSSFMSSPLLAIECCLDGFQSVPVDDETTMLMENLVTEQELSVSFKGPKLVSVLAGDVDLKEQLLKSKPHKPTSPAGKGPADLSGGSSTRSPPSQSAFGSNPRSPPAQPSFGSRQGFGGASPPSTSLPQKFQNGMPPSGSAEAIITHLDQNTGMFWVQLVSSEAQLSQLSSKLQSVYGSGGPPLKGSPEKGMPCCAKFSLDGCWYRSVVESVSGGKVKVQFVDYGNDDLVPVSNLRAITPDLLQIPMQMFSCTLKGLKSWNGKMAKTFSSTALDEKLNVRFVTSNSPYLIQASVNGQDLLQLMLKSPAPSPQKGFGGGTKKPYENQQQHPPAGKGFGSSHPKSFSEKPQRGFGASNKVSEDEWGGNSYGSSSQTSPSSKLPDQVFQVQHAPSSVEAAYVSHVADDGTFYMQLVKDIGTIDDLTSKVENAPVLRHPNPRVGAACGAMFSEDKCWYRGIIKSVSGSSAEVLFVDFGNGEKSEISSLKPLPSHLLTPALAYQCQVDETGLLTTEQQEAFRVASGDKEYDVTFKKGNPFSVTIKDESGTNLADTIFKPTSIRLPPTPKELVLAAVSHVGENDRFYLQLCSEEDALAKLTDEVQETCEGQVEKLCSFDEGQVCCAKFSEDEAWYRAYIVKDNGETATVLFVDYGNMDTVNKDEILVIPPSLMTRPSFAYDCKLQGVKSWKEDQKKKFVAMTDGKTMNARFLSSKPPYEVELTRSIGLELMEDESEEAEGEEEFSDAKETPEETGVVQSSAESYVTIGSQAESFSKPDDKETSDAQSSVETPSATEPQTESPSKPDDKDVALKHAFPAQTPPALDACIISHVDSDGIFYLQLTSEDESRDTLSDKLQEECESPESKTLPPAINLACCAMFSEEELWYRALVEKIEGETVVVRFVDFGNTDSVPVSDLKEASAESLSVPPLAYRCILEDSESDLVSKRLEEVTLDQVLTVTFTTTETVPYTVTLHLENGTDVSTLLVPLENGTDVSTLLVPSDLESKTPAPVTDSAGISDSTAEADRKCISLSSGHRMKVVISQVVSPSLFYVQSSTEKVEELSEAMFEHYTSLAEGEGQILGLSVDQLCASPFGEDEDIAWYRAVVRSIDADIDTCELFYVDYGNSDCVPRSSVRELEPEFKLLPWQCVSCSLAGVHCTEEDWSEEVNAAFGELATDKSVLADVFSGDGIDQPYVVHVLDLGLSLAESLLALSLPGVEAAETPKLDSVQHTFSASESLASDLQDLALNETWQDVTDNILGEKEEVENSEKKKETVDDIGESEQEFCQHLKECTAQIESTMLDDTVSRRQTENANSTQLEESSGAAGDGAKNEKEEKHEEAKEEDAKQGEKEEREEEKEEEEEGEEEEEEEEEEEDFEDAVDAEEDGNVTVHTDDHQRTWSCVSDGLAELEWIDVHICVAVSASEFWCQLPSARSVLSGSTIGIEKARATEVVTDITVGHLYLVCDPPVSNYRAKVLALNCDDDKVKVLKIDYGAEDNVPRNCLSPLAKHQLELPAQAYCCCLSDEDATAEQEWLNNAISKGEAVDKSFQIKVVGRKPCGTLLVDVREMPGEDDYQQQSSDSTSSATERDTDTSRKVKGSEVSLDALEISSPELQSTVLGDQSSMEKSNGNKDYILEPLDKGEEYIVTVANGGTPDSFYAIRVCSKGLLDALADEINVEVEENENIMVLAVGNPCLVLDEASSKWVRGQVKSCGDEYEVLCVDSGILLHVGKDSVKELPPCLLDTPTQAILCCLADIVPVEETWCDDALTFFIEFIQNSPLKLTLSGLSTGREKHQVSLSKDQPDDDEDSADHLVGSVPTVNRTLVEIGYAEAVAGSPLDIELQVERTVYDSDKMDQMETSFGEVTRQRENSFGEDSSEDNVESEQDQNDVDASGDATKAFQTESEEGSEFHTAGAAKLKLRSPADFSLRRGTSSRLLLDDRSVLEDFRTDKFFTPQNGEATLEGSGVTGDFSGSVEISTTPIISGEGSSAEDSSTNITVCHGFGDHSDESPVAAKDQERVGVPGSNLIDNKDIASESCDAENHQIALTHRDLGGGHDGDMTNFVRCYAKTDSGGESMEKHCGIGDVDSLMSPHSDVKDFTAHVEMLITGGCCSAGVLHDNDFDVDGNIPVANLVVADNDTATNFDSAFGTDAPTENLTGFSQVTLDKMALISEDSSRNLAFAGDMPALDLAPSVDVPLENLAVVCDAPALKLTPSGDIPLENLVVASDTPADSLLFHAEHSEYSNIVIENAANDKLLDDKEHMDFRGQIISHNLEKGKDVDCEDRIALGCLQQHVLQEPGNENEEKKKCLQNFPDQVELKLSPSRTEVCNQTQHTQLAADVDGYTPKIPQNLIAISSVDVQSSLITAGVGNVSTRLSSMSADIESGTFQMSPSTEDIESAEIFSDVENSKYDRAPSSSDVYEHDLCFDNTGDEYDTAKLCGETEKFGCDGEGVQKQGITIGGLLEAGDALKLLGSWNEDDIKEYIQQSSSDQAEFQVSPKRAEVCDQPQVFQLITAADDGYTPKIPEDVVTSECDNAHLSSAADDGYTPKIPEDVATSECDNAHLSLDTAGVEYDTTQMSPTIEDTDGGRTRNSGSEEICLQEVNASDSSSTQAEEAQQNQASHEQEDQVPQAFADSPGHHSEEFNQHNFFFVKDATECSLPSSCESASDGSFSQDKFHHSEFFSSHCSPMPTLGDFEDQPAGTSSPRQPSHHPFVLKTCVSNTEHTDSTVGCEPNIETYIQLGLKLPDASEADGGELELQTPTASAALSTSACGDFMEAQLTVEDMEKVAAQLESMSLLETQKQEEEDAEQHRVELAQIIDDYGKCIEHESDETISDRMTSPSCSETFLEVTPEGTFDGCQNFMEAGGSSSKHQGVGLSPQAEVCGGRGECRLPADDSISRHQDERFSPQAGMFGGREECELPADDSISRHQDERLSPQAEMFGDRDECGLPANCGISKHRSVESSPQTEVCGDRGSCGLPDNHSSSREDEQYLTPLSMSSDNTDNLFSRSDLDSSQEEAVVVPSRSRYGPLSYWAEDRLCNLDF